MEQLRRLTDPKRVSGEEITSILYSTDKSYRIAVLKNPNATKDQLGIALGDSSSTVIRAAIAHPNAVDSQIRLGLARLEHEFEIPGDMAEFLRGDDLVTENSRVMVLLRQNRT